MSGDNDYIKLMVEDLKLQQASTSQEIRDLTASTNQEIRALTSQIAELVTSMTVKSQDDKHKDRIIEDHHNRINNISSRLHALEKVQAGNEASGTIAKWFLQPLASAAMVAVFVGVAWAVASSKGWVA